MLASEKKTKYKGSILVKKSIYSIISLGLLTLLSRILGLIRDLCIAWFSCNTMRADALVVAVFVPHVLRKLYGDGVLSMGLTTSLIAGGRSLSFCNEDRETILYWGLFASFMPSSCKAVLSRLSCDLLFLRFSFCSASPVCDHWNFFNVANSSSLLSLEKYKWS